MDLLQEGGLLPGLKVGSYLTLGNELSEETHLLTKQEILLGKDTRVENSKAREPRKTALPVSKTVLWLAVLGFMVMELVSRLSLANHLTQSPSWWCMPCSAKMDAREKDSGRWSDM